MTLSVEVSRTDWEGVQHALPLESSLAGFEETRRTFYGSSEAVKRGLRLLPLLNGQATVSIDADSFGDFLRELDTLEAMAREADTYDSYWRYRLDNLRGAVAAARDHGPTAKVEIG